MNPRNRIPRRSALALLASATIPTWAQTSVPDKPLRIILPIGARSGVDTIARATTTSLMKALGGRRGH